MTLCLGVAKFSVALYLGHDNMNGTHFFLQHPLQGAPRTSHSSTHLSLQQFSLGHWIGILVWWIQFYFFRILIRLFKKVQIHIDFDFESDLISQ